MGISARLIIGTYPQNFGKKNSKTNASVILTPFTIAITPTTKILK
jgi:hypothetical protein